MSGYGNGGYMLAQKWTDMVDGGEVKRDGVINCSPSALRPNNQT